MTFDDYEKEILEAYENKKIKQVKLSKKRKNELKTVARNTLTKDKRVNIRISSKDLRDLQLKAIQDGIPYQTLMSSVLHKFVNGRFTESQSVRLLQKSKQRRKA